MNVIYLTAGVAVAVCIVCVQSISVAIIGMGMRSYAAAAVRRAVCVLCVVATGGIDYCSV